MSKFKIDAGNKNFAAIKAWGWLMIRFAGVVVSLGILGWLLWKLPVWEFLAGVLYFAILPLIILGAAGVVSFETVRAANRILKWGRSTEARGILGDIIQKMKQEQRVPVKISK